jgi:hypothetical protein
MKAKDGSDHGQGSLFTPKTNTYSGQTSYDSDQNVHPNSIASYHAIDDLGERQRRVYRAVQAMNEITGACTDRQVLRYLYGEDTDNINRVQPRITELIQMGLIREAGNTTCGFTGRSVRTLLIVDPPCPKTGGHCAKTEGKS